MFTKEELKALESIVAQYSEEAYFLTEEADRILLKIKKLLASKK